jgi:hypothetical protein
MAEGLGRSFAAACELILPLRQRAAATLKVLQTGLNQFFFVLRPFLGQRYETRNLRTLVEGLGLLILTRRNGFYRAIETPASTRNTLKLQILPAYNLFIIGSLISLGAERIRQVVTKSHPIGGSGN